MKQIAISKFKATCLAVLDQVRRTRTPVLITRFGKPVAQVIPPPAPDVDAGWIGSMEGTGRINDDLIEPVTDPADWDALER